MKQRCLFIFLAMAARVLFAGDAPTVDLYAGWSWSPFSYYNYPYRYGGYPFWDSYPHAGLMVPLDGRDESLPYFPHGYTGYEPFWGYEYGVRIRLKGDREYPALSGELLPPLPGSAPLAPRDPQREKSWDRDIETFLGTLGSEWRAPAQTNAQPKTSLVKP